MNGLIVLLCRNTLTLSSRCLETLLAQTARVNILVVDNASTDGTGKHMSAQQSQHPNLFRMTFQTVTSVARCWNEALQWGWDRGHGEALVVNADTELLPDTYKLLKDYIYAAEVGMVTAVGVADNPSYPTELAVRPHPDYSCYMIARWAHQQIPFDEGYEGGYFEDADHHARMYRAGIWAGSINLGFKHYSSGTLKFANEHEANRINNHYRRNKARFLGQYGCVPGTKAYERLFTGSEPQTPASPAPQTESS